MMTPARRTLLVLMLTCMLGGVAAVRLQMSYDLGAFLPPPATSAQTLLTQRLGQGPGAQLIFVELPGASLDEVLAIAAELRAHPLIRRVLPEALQLNSAALPTVLWQHRLLLGALPDSTPAWLETLAQRTDDLMFAADDDTLALIAADPALLSITAIREFTAGAHLPNFEQDGVHYLMLEAAVPGFQLAEQTGLIADVRSTLSAQRGARVLGSPVYAVDLQSEVRYEATLFSALAGLALLLLMIVRFRSVHRVIGVALPLAAGGVGGLFALTLIFTEIHGITLAFGFTLMGVAIDYPLHLYTHADRASEADNRNIWRVLRLGIASTLIAYGAFIFSGTPGLQQLGVFAFSGIAVAALTAAWLCAGQLPTTRADADGTAHRAAMTPQSLRWWPSIATFAAAGAVLYAIPVFNDNLANLTPVDPELLAADAQLRNQLGVADIRYLLSVRASSEEQALQATEQVTHTLSPLIEGGELSGVQSITEVLPSRRTQQARYEQLGAPTLAQFREALSQSPLAPDAFAPFEQALLQQQQHADYLSSDELRRDAQLGGVVDNLLFADKEDWVSLVFLRGLTDAQALAALFSEQPHVELVDLKTTSEQMVSSYRANLTGVLLMALLLIALGLSTQVRPHRAAWLLISTAAAVSCAAACSALWQGGLSLFDLMALTLVAGLGLDYVLFYSRERRREDDQVTASAVRICALSSLIVFGILSLSSIPVLQGIGTTVAIGVAAAYTLARFGRYANTGH